MKMKMVVHVINAETKALHHSTIVIFERTEVEAKLHSSLQKFAIVEEVSHLKMGKLSNSSNQKNANYRLQLEERPRCETWICKEFLPSFLIYQRN